MHTHATIVGGGAAGFFAAIHCKTLRPDAPVVLLEKGRKLLAKVQISGGGRCNVTHACFDPKQLTTHYPRGHRELLGPFHRWNPTHTIEWFGDRGVELKTEADGRMFPVTDSSSTIMDCLIGEARDLGVEVRTECGLQRVEKPLKESDPFTLECTDGSTFTTTNLMLASGGNHASIGMKTAAAFGHTIAPPVPSLFTFNIDHAVLRDLPGVAVNPVQVGIDGCKNLTETGPLLITHWGVSGPAVLKLSAWGARELAERSYNFEVNINWLGGLTREQALAELSTIRKQRGTQSIAKKSPFESIPRRLWERLVHLANIPVDTPWSRLQKDATNRLTDLLVATRLPARGKSTNKEEFVTCGGVTLKEIDMKRMESRIQPRLYVAGEMIDIDGITGGFNFQAAWTGGYLAGCAMAE